MLKRSRHIVLTLLVVTAFCVHMDHDYGFADEMLYEMKCGRCHTAFKPGDYSPEDWPGIVRSMRAPAGLTGAQYDSIVEYVVSASGSEGGQTSSSSGPNIGGYLYSEYFQTEQEIKNYDIHYLSVSLSGWAKDNIYYMGEFELEHGGTGGDNTFIEQAYIDYWFNSNLAFRAGAILAPFNRFDDFHDPLRNYTITRPQVSREIGVSAWKDVGVDFHGFFNIGDQSSIAFNIYSINGLGSGSNLRGSRQYRDNNEDKAFGGRVSWLLLDVLEVGGSIYNGAWDDDGKLDLTMYGTHFLLRTDLADFYGEYSRADSDNPSPAADGKMSGYFIQASRLFLSKFRPTVRFGALDYLDMGDTLGRSTAKGDKDLSELALSFGYYPTNKVVFKVEYTFFMEGDRMPDTKNDQLGLQAAVAF